MAYWPFDEPEGSTAEELEDLVPDALDGTLSGGKFGNAVEFDGIGDYVDGGANTELDITGPLTVSAWIKPDVFDVYKSIVVKGDASTEKINYGLQMLGSAVEGVADGVLRFFTFDSGYSFVTSTGVVPDDGLFHHVAVTVDAAGTVKFFIDGSVTDTFTLFPVPLPTSTKSLDIGRHRHVSLGASQFWDGVIDEVRISDVARTSFVLTSPPSDDLDTVALWHLDESVGTDVFDASTSFASDGTMVGATWAGPTRTIGRTGGMFGNALEFDGTDHVTAPREGMDPKVGTFEMWVRPADLSVKPQAFIVVDASTSSTDANNYQMQYWLDGRLYFRVAKSFQQVVVPAATVATVFTEGEWHHLAMSWGPFGVRAYVDGSLVGTPFTGAMTFFAPPFDLTSDAFIGSWYQSTPQGFRNFIGRIDEVRISKIARYPAPTSSFDLQTAPFVADGDTVALWHFDTSDGDEVFDASSSLVNNGDIFGATWAGPVPGNALLFDGVDDFVAFPADAALSPTAKITIAAWIRPDVLPGAGASMAIVSKWDPGVSESYMLSVDGVGTGAFLSLGITDASSPTPISKVARGTTALAAGEWVHVAGRFGSPFTLKLDGAPEPLAIDPSVAPTTIAANPALPVRIGADLADGSAFEGLIDEVQIYDHLLPDDQIEILAGISTTLIVDNIDNRAGFGPSIACAGVGGVGIRTFVRIGDAVVQAVGGGTVEVCPGTYEEDITLDKPMTLRSVVKHAAVISSEIIIDSDDDTVVDFTVLTSTFGIKVEGFDRALIIGNEIDGSGTAERGIIVRDSEGTIVGTTVLGEGNDVHDIDGIGILVDASDAVLDAVEVIGNDVHDIVGTGISVVDGSRNVKVEDNDLDDISPLGIGVGGSSDVKVERNDLDDISGTGISVFGSSSNVNVEDNDLDDFISFVVTGIVVLDSSDVNVEDNDLDDFLGLGAFGIGVYRSRDVNVDDNDLDDITGFGLVTGIDVGGSSYVIVEDNDLDDIDGSEATGIGVTESTRVIVDDNNVDDIGSSSGVGILFEAVSFSDITDNDVEDTGSHGIWLRDGSDPSHDNLLAENEVEDAEGNGIFLDGNAHHNTVWENEVEDAEGDGIAAGALTHDNTFIDNEIEDSDGFDASDASPTPAGGRRPALTANTWIDNECDDSDPDGLCEDDD